MYNTDMPTRAELPSSRKLIRSTLIALAAAATLLVTVVLPAEYAVDPTGIGKVLGLTEMGEIKQQLALEAAAVEQTAVLIETLETAETQADERAADQVVDTEKVVSLAPVETAPERTDVVTLTLAPGEAAEVKLTMKKDGIAKYEWVTNQGHLNSDLHADGANKAFVSYRKGRSETSNTGEFIAGFEGVHGWFWRNRSDVDVEVTLRVSGAYSEVKRVL